MLDGYVACCLCTEILKQRLLSTYRGEITELTIVNRIQRTSIDYNYNLNLHCLKEITPTSTI